MNAKHKDFKKDKPKKVSIVNNRTNIEKMKMNGELTLVLFVMSPMIENCSKHLQ